MYANSYAGQRCLPIIQKALMPLMAEDLVQKRAGGKWYRRSEESLAHMHDLIVAHQIRILGALSTVQFAVGEIIRIVLWVLEFLLLCDSLR
jgi:nitric oxide reductase large subunit